MNFNKIPKILIPKEIKFYLKALTLLFIISSILGFFTATLLPLETGEVIKKTAIDFSFIKNFSKVEIFFLIFLNNSTKVFFMMLLGTIFGIIPVIFILLNGYMVGIVVSVMITNIGIWSVILGILPHGIFEIPAVLITAGYGIWLGEMFSKKLYKKSAFIPSLKIALRKYIVVILPLLLLAALIETFLTDKLLSIFLM